MTITEAEAEAVIVAKVPRFMQDRALEIFHHLTYSQTTVARITYLRVPTDWPARDITFRRNGRPFVMGMRGNKFIGAKA